MTSTLKNEIKTVTLQPLNYDSPLRDYSFILVKCNSL